MRDEWAKQIANHSNLPVSPTKPDSPDITSAAFNRPVDDQDGELSEDLDNEIGNAQDVDDDPFVVNDPTEPNSQALYKRVSTVEKSLDVIQEFIKTQAKKSANFRESSAKTLTELREELQTWSDNNAVRRISQLGLIGACTYGHSTGIQQIVGWLRIAQHCFPRASRKHMEDFADSIVQTGQNGQLWSTADISAAFVEDLDEDSKNLLDTLLTSAKKDLKRETDNMLFEAWPESTGNNSSLMQSFALFQPRATSSKTQPDEESTTQNADFSTDTNEFDALAEALLRIKNQK